MLSHNATKAFVRDLCGRPSLHLITRCLSIVNSSRTNQPQLNLRPLTRQSSSSTRWKTRQAGDAFSREAKVQGLKSRAAFKLLEIDAKYRIFKKGMTVVDLGYAPGSWSQVAVERTKPNGRIIGIDIIPAQPPRGVSTIQGNFLSPAVQSQVKLFLQDPDLGRVIPAPVYHTDGTLAEVEVEQDQVTIEWRIDRKKGRKKIKADPGTVDVVLSDMCEPWAQTSGFWKRTLSNPYYRMMNTSGINFKDHTGSMDLCNAALTFANDTLKVGGHFICKFYQGAEDKYLEARLKKIFTAVHKDKPKSSRSESNEAYFVALKRKTSIPLAKVDALVEPKHDHDLMDTDDYIVGVDAEAIERDDCVSINATPK